MKKVLGLVLIGFSFLTAAIILMLSKVLQHLSENSGVWYSNFFRYIPFIVWVFFIIAIGISIYLIKDKDKDKVDV